MANGADGSIVIDTQLDNTGFKRGSLQMQNSVNGLIQGCKQAGRSLASAVQSVNPALRDLAQNAQQTGQTIGDGLAHGAFSSAMDNMGKQIASLSGQLTRLGNAESAGIKSDAQMRKFQQSIDAARESVAAIILQINRFANTPIYSDEYTRQQQELQRLEAEMEKVSYKQKQLDEEGVSDDSPRMVRLEAEWQRLNNQYDEALQKMQAIRDAGNYIQLGGDTAQYQQIAGIIQEASAQLEHFGNVQQQTAPKTHSASGALSRLGSILSGLGGLASTAVSGLSAIGSMLIRIGHSAVSAMAGLARLSWKGIRSGAVAAANGVRSLVGHLKNLHKTGKQSALTSNGLVKALFSVKRMLLSRIKRTFISALFNSLKEGMGAFARYSSAFNAAMSSMKNSMTGLSGNLAVAAGNLVNAIAPAISTIIDWISQAITYLNAFFALLSGKSTYTVAKKGTDNYAKSLKGAGGAAKELKNEVYGFDELNKAKDDSSGGGGGGSGGSVDFEEKSLADLPDSIKNFMQSLKDAFAAGEWEKIGAIVAGGLNTVVSTVDNWITGTLEPAGVKWASRFARVLNGFNDAFDFYNLGSTISHGFNAILRIVNAFLTDFDAFKLGEKIGDGINGITDNLDWELLGETLADGIGAVIDTLAGAVTSIRWGDLGANFGRGINAFIGNFHWEELETFIVEGINGVVDALDKIVSDNALWSNLADKLATSVHNIIEKINWSKMIFTVTLGLLRVVNVFFTILATVNWSKLGTDFANGVNKIFGTDANGNSNINWSEITGNISRSINGITELFSNFITGVQWGSIATQFAKNVNSIIDGVDWGKMILTVALGIARLANTFFIMIANIKWSELGRKVADGLNKIFANGEGSLINWNELGKNFSEAVKSILTGLDTFITETDWFQVGQTIADGLANVDWLGIANKLLTLLKDAVLAAALAGYSFFDRIAQWILGEVPEEGIEVDIPIVFSEETNNSLKDQAGEAGRNAALAIYQEFTANMGMMQAEADGTVSEWAQRIGASGEKEVIAAAAMIGLGYQNEMLQWLQDGDFQVEGAAAASELANHLFAAITVDGVTVSNVKTAFSNAGIEVTDGFAEAITGQGQANISAALLLLGAGVDQDTIAALDISHLHENLFAYMNETGADLNTVANELATNTGESLGRLLPEGMSQGLAAGKETLEGTVDDLESIASTADSHDTITAQAETTGGDVTDELGGGMDSGQSTVETAAENTVEAIESPISKLPEEVKPYAELLMAAITQQIVDGNPVAVEAINAAAEEIVTTASNILTGEAGAEIINTFIGGMESKIRSMESTLTSATQSAANKVVNTFKNILTVSAGHSIGQNIAQGIAAGITSTTSTIVAAATRAAQAALAAAKSSLGIRSPSKAFAEVGDYMMQGMAVGLKEGQGNVIKTVSSVAQNAIDSAQNSAVDMGAGSMISGLEGILSKLVHGIDNAISAMGGLPVPAVASGAFAPYKIRGGNGVGTNGVFGLSAEDKQRLAGIDELQSETNNLLRQLIRAVNEKDMNMDGRSMEESLTSLQRSRIRSFGGT